MLQKTTEKMIWAIVVNIEDPHYSFVAKEIVTTDELINIELAEYRDMNKYRIITV